ncbi:MAG: SusF/SusE family outer membrane protein [Dysgonamonadaceae bacterium]|jgi:hypothetical protein|nr:SusF/SusE family outer membrane protein [Dysgonamonadaceae bacterium]
MKRRIVNYLCLAVGALLLFACEKSDTDGVTGESLTLTASAEKVVLLEANEAETAITFTWNKGIDRKPTDTITYIFRMDIANRDFATATPRDTVTGFTKSFTVGELNELVATQWDVYPGEEIGLEARVVANVRGEKFVYPEIAVTKFTVIAYAYASVPLYMTGSAVPGSEPIAITETVNGRLYKWQGLLNQGGFKFLYNLHNDLPSLNKGVDNNTMVERTDASQPDDLFPVGKAGFYMINVDSKNMKINYSYAQYYFPNIYPVGTATTADWNLGNLSVPWDDANPGKYVYEGPLKEGEFKIHSENNWSSGAFRPTQINESGFGNINSTEVQFAVSPDWKWFVNASEAGNYRITLDVNAMKIYFDKQ